MSPLAAWRRPARRSMNLQPAGLAGDGIGGRARDGHAAVGRDDDRVEQVDAVDGECCRS